MPIGPYPNWAACHRAQVAKGHSPESADRICGFIEKRTKGNTLELTAAEALYLLYLLEDKQ